MYKRCLWDVELCFVSAIWKMRWEYSLEGLAHVVHSAEHNSMFFLSLAQANVAGNWEFEYMKVGKLLSSSEQIEGSVLFSFQSMKTGSGIKSCKLICEQMAKLLVLSMWGCQCTIAKTACSGLAVLWQATQIPHGNSLVQVTFKTLS